MSVYFHETTDEEGTYHSLRSNEALTCIVCGAELVKLTPFQYLQVILRNFSRGGITFAQAKQVPND